MAACLESSDDPRFLRRVDPREYRGVFRDRGERRVVQLSQIRAGAKVPGINAHIPADPRRHQRMISSEHLHRDPALGQIRQRPRRRFSGQVTEADETGQRQAGLVVWPVRPRLSPPGGYRDREEPHAIVRVAVNQQDRPLSVGPGQRDIAAVGADAAAAGDYFLRRSLRDQQVPPDACPGDDRDAAARVVEGNDVHHVRGIVRPQGGSRPVVEQRLVEHPGDRGVRGCGRPVAVQPGELQHLRVSVAGRI